MLESLARANKPEDAVFMLVVDQFEELFTLCDNEAERQAFLAQLLYVSQFQRNRGFIILTMRADFYGKAAAYKRLAEAITQNDLGGRLSTTEFTNEVIGRVGAKLEVWKGLR